MAENIISGKKYKVLQNGVWNLFSFFTKASDVEFDDGMNAEEKMQDIERNGFGVELTQSAYNALSESERNNGTYWVTDGEGGEGDGSGVYIETTDVINNLTSTATNLPLSAKQGKVLNEKMLHIVSFDAATGTLITKSWDYAG